MIRNGFSKLLESHRGGAGDCPCGQFHHGNHGDERGNDEPHFEKYYHTEDGGEIQKDCKERVLRHLAKNVPVKTGAVEILGRCRILGIKTAVASSSPLRQIENNLENAGMENCFDAIVSGDEVERGNRRLIYFFWRQSGSAFLRENVPFLKTAPTASKAHCARE